MKNKGAKIIVNSITMTRVIGTLLMPFISLLLSPGELIFYIIILLLTDSVDGIMAILYHRNVTLQSPFLTDLK